MMTGASTGVLYGLVITLMRIPIKRDMVSNILIEVMSSIAEEERLKNHQRQSEGIMAAKNKGVVFGRPNIRKPENYEAVMEKVMAGELKAVEAMRELGVKKTTFYKLKKLYM